MVKLDYYTSLGYALDLLTRSDFHKGFLLGDYFHTEVLPPIIEGQFRFYASEDGIPNAMITWAFLSQEVLDDILETSRAIRHDEWTSGDRLFFNDWITPYGNIKSVVADMATNVFPDATAVSVRRNPDGSIRRVKRWTGANIRKAEAA